MSLWARLLKAARGMRFDAPPREFWRVLDRMGPHVQ